MVQPLWKTELWFLKNFKTELPCNPTIPLLGMHPKDVNSARHGHTCVAVFMAAYSQQSKSRSDQSVHRWVNGKQNVVYVHIMGYSSLL